MSTEFHSSNIKQKVAGLWQNTCRLFGGRNRSRIDSENTYSLTTSKLTPTGHEARFHSDSVVNQRTSVEQFHKADSVSVEPKCVSPYPLPPTRTVSDSPRKTTSHSVPCIVKAEVSTVKPELSLATIKYLHEPLKMKLPICALIATGNVDGFVTSLLSDDTGQLVKKLGREYRNLGAEEKVECYIQRWLVNENHTDTINWAHFIQALKINRNSVLAVKVERYLDSFSYNHSEGSSEIKSVRYTNALAEEVDLINLTGVSQGAVRYLHVNLCVLEDDMLSSFGEELFLENGGEMLMKFLQRGQDFKLIVKVHFAKF
ncbi:hypothetical protein D5018_11775 [Parashewanella curva]|uniref:Uncharacterized protein n=1 Tax=Parashewanella curva TaxID=2338552 RepID=A0A3L8PZM2_9GAMM|nr:hypothetical protein [Parashewanella curva]RLV59542.1 hypothetical protein D5018_11775 [Parashewanella curva]